MSFVETLLVITGGLCISLIIAIIQAYERTRSAEHQNAALVADKVKLLEQLKKEADQNKITFDRLREYYDEQVEREKKQVVSFHEDKHAKLHALIAEYETRLAARTPALETDFEFDDDPKPDSALPPRT